MKRLATCFVALARSAGREAQLYHLLGDIELEEHARQLVRHYLDSARTAQTNYPHAA